MRRFHQLRASSLIALFFLLLIALPTAKAQQDEIATRKLGISKLAGTLQVSFNYKDVFTSTVRRKLNSGLPTRVILQINLERQGISKPISYWARTTTVVYDLWEESYIVTVEDNNGRRRAKAETADKAVDLASTLLKTQVARIKGQPPGTYRLRAVIEVNPVSKEMVANIRRWLAKPSSGSGGVEGQANFFGSFVGVFVDRRIGQADHRVSFVSQWFRLGES